MKENEYIETFMEGALLAPHKQTLESVLSMVFNLRKQVANLQDTIEGMDDVVRGSDWTIECRSCKEFFSPDCELSEIVHSEHYCGKNEWCCP